ncbi:24437_t:CDS:2 [Dentiscutata erythropus]|uniref:24437_t:CDS:1 n=1 Tax=Dentiscutata erythropus TaxID=1348616 RepID=A0A9N9HNA3_9GLOM|nr:24437_t:CDS:2 [Dentiscutata erythropus]
MDVFKVDVIEDSKDELCSEDDEYKEDYEDKEGYEDEIEEMDYERTEEVEEQWNTWEIDESEVGHSDIAWQWWKYENERGAEIALSQDEETLDDEESQVEVVINSGITSLTTPERKNSTEE